MKFWKYHGTGNDFIMIDGNCEAESNVTETKIKSICHRHYGIGADGVIVLSQAEEVLQMRYYNADGKEGSFCGNGGRCFVQFAIDRQYVNPRDTMMFKAFDGMHQAKIGLEGLISLQMRDVLHVEKLDGYTYRMNTGSPHLVIGKEDLFSLDVAQLGAQIRYSPEYAAEGINVNFVRKETAEMRTYERGVENETMSCGTGTIAAGISLHEWKSGSIGAFEYAIKTAGGILLVNGVKTAEGAYTNLHLIGPALRVFSGEI